MCAAATATRLTWLRQLESPLICDNLALAILDKLDPKSAAALRQEVADLSS